MKRSVVPQMQVLTQFTTFAIFKYKTHQYRIIRGGYEVDNSHSKEYSIIAADRS